MDKLDQMSHLIQTKTQTEMSAQPQSDTESVCLLSPPNTYINNNSFNGQFQQYSSSDASVQTDDSLVDEVQQATTKKKNNQNNYSKTSYTRHQVTFDSSISLSRPNVRSYEEAVVLNQRLHQAGPLTKYLDRELHSTNDVVNKAFETHRKNFIRKNRAVDWILKQDIPNVEALKNTEHVSPPLDNQSSTEQDRPTPPIENNHWGDCFPKDKPSRHTRMFFQNIRSLQTSKRNSQDKWAQFLNFCHQHSVDLIGAAETCTNTTRHRIRHLLQRTAQKEFIQANLCWSENDFVTDTNYRPGGTLLTTTDSWTGRIVRALHDPHKMGRWCGNEYKLGLNKRLFMFSAYRVCKQSPELGLISSYRQQFLKLQQRTPGESNICPRKSFIIDFVSYVQSLNISSEDYLVVMIDANEQINEDVFGICTLMEKLKLIDTFTRYHNKSCDISTHHTSKNKRIDFILSSANVIPHVAACGYLAFYEGVDTDHRGLFLEFKSSFLDGQARIERPPSRLIGKTTSKKEVFRYKQFLHEKYTERDIFVRASTLYEKARNSMFTGEDLRQLNILDREVTQLMLRAEQETCSKKPSFPWSPTMHRAGLLIKFWTLKYRNRKVKYDISQQLSQIYDQLSEEQQQTINNTSAGIKSNLHKAKIEKQILQAKAMEKRQEDRRLRIEQEATYRQTKVSHEYKRLAMIDETHHLYRYLEKIYGKKRSIGLQTIEVPFRDKQGNLTDDPKLAESWIQIHDPDEIVTRLIHRNIKHFGQAQGSAFTTLPIADAFGYQGCNQNVENLIYEKRIPVEIQDNITEGARMILEKLADGKPLKQICDKIDIEDFWKAFQNWDEQTSTSPSGRHLGHYRALLMADGNDENYGEDGTKNPSYELQTVYYHIALAATLSGNTLDRWCHSSTMMIEKIPGQPRIDKLRVIHIFEADFNLMLKILWSRRLVWQTHKQSRLHEAQAGSRPDHRCIDVVLRKTMNYLYSALTRTPLITIDNDAKACYDRIPCNLAMIVSRYFGMPQVACQFLATTLQEMKFRIRTNAGDSQASYQHSTETPIHGTGQGSCASPCLWLLISSTLFECYEKRATGMTQYDVHPDFPIRTCAIEGFVDDTSIFINPSFAIEVILSWIHIIPELIQAAKQDLDLWNMLLDAAGGKLALEKCFWYLLCWYFNAMGDPVPLSLDLLQDMFPGTITVEDKESHQQVTLEQKDIHDAHRTLGAFKSIAGNEDRQFEVLMEKSNNLAVTTKLGQLSRFQARRAFSSIYIPSMTYSL